MKNFKHQALKELTDQQVRFATPEKRLEQLSRTENLLNEIDPDKTYPYPFICYRVTDFRPDSYGDLLMIGSDVIHDLGLFLSELARSMPAIPAEEMAEPVLTLEEISKKLNVTTKTINRWRSPAGPSWHRQPDGNQPSDRTAVGTFAGDGALHDQEL